MDWNKELDGYPLMPISKLVELLAMDVPRDPAQEMDPKRKHIHDVIRLLEQGCQLGNVKIFYGSSETLAEFRNSFNELELHSKRLKNFLPKKLHRNSERLHYSEGLHSHTVDIHLRFNGCLQEVYKLEVRPGEVVRWMNSFSKGQELLPASLREYLAAAVTAVSSETTTGKTTKTPQLTYEVSAKDAAERLGVSVRTIQNWDTKRFPKHLRYPGRTSLTAFQMFAARWDYEKQQKEIAQKQTMKQAISGGDIAGKAMRGGVRTVDDEEE